MSGQLICTDKCAPFLLVGLSEHIHLLLTQSSQPVHFLPSLPTCYIYAPTVPPSLNISESLHPGLPACMNNWHGQLA